MTDPVEAITIALLEADGYDADYELTGYGTVEGIAKKYQRLAEIAIDTLKGIGWDEVEPYREALQKIARYPTSERWLNDVAKEVLSRFEVGA